MLSGSLIAQESKERPQNHRPPMGHRPPGMPPGNSGGPGSRSKDIKQLSFHDERWFAD